MTYVSDATAMTWLTSLSLGQVGDDPWREISTLHPRRQQAGGGATRLSDLVDLA